jgi:5-methylcytosine-specific restriction protein A
VTRQVTLVCGPPCAGKTVWVADQVAASDVEFHTVLDIDVLAKLCGSSREHGHEGKYYRAAQREFDALCEVVRNRPVGTAWVIRGAPEATARAKLADAVNATRTVILMPTRDTLFERALARDTHINGSAVDTMRAITRWFQRYQPARGDELILSDHQEAR